MNHDKFSIRFRYGDTHCHTNCATEDVNNSPVGETRDRHRWESNLLHTRMGQRQNHQAECSRVIRATPSKYTSSNIQYPCFKIRFMRTHMRLYMRMRWSDRIQDNI
jgi:hypothetical protein